ncbi:OmpA family protein [Mucilaginibacter sp. UYCu711]|uniref:OmpA family protein n=1 Tax=Mucilaginibacter sp. UYCu711 TaxID=3156339 RepID=UPI003D21BC42
MLNTYKTIKRSIIASMMLFLASTTVEAQVTPPTWWFGLSGAANANWYDGTTQTLNSNLVVPTAFHKAFGIRPYGSVLIEYRPTPIIGAMLNVAYDGRGAKYTDVIAPCNCLATLHTNIDYVSAEPSIRLGFKTNRTYFFAGPTFSYNIRNEFTYTQEKQPNRAGNLSDTKKFMFGGQVGLGYDIMLSAPTNIHQVSLSPFASYHPYFGQEPRSIESMSVQTLRIGMALKFGKGHKAPEPVVPPMVVIPAAAPHEFTLAVRGPKTMGPRREVSETLPLLNAVFFDEASATIPSRYVLLSNSDAANFHEMQLQQQKSTSIPGHSAGQLNVYHNLLNIIGDRMRANPGTFIVLNGASVNGPSDGKTLAASVKQYLVTVFGIEGSRIAVQGSFKPRPPSGKIGGTKDLALLGAENRRVDIESSSPELLDEIGGGMMKPVSYMENEDPLDRSVVLTVDSAQQLLKSWSVDVAPANGPSQHYGPYTSNVANIPAQTILANSPGGDYTITMNGETTNGTPVTKTNSVHLERPDQTVIKGVRYSIVFSFDKSTTIAQYNKFLTNTVAPLITSGSNVVIHGHTDVIGGTVYNQKLSESRAKETQQIIERALANKGVSNVKFDTSGFGADASHAPFDNNLPEERFYNRTVIIDINK